MKTFAMTGAAGYIAPRHIQAIKECGHELIAAMDIHDSVGILDTYFPQVYFFTAYERFDRYLHKQQRKSQSIDYLSVCSPNHLHDAHCRLGLRNGCDVICEKPLVLNPWNIDALQELELETGRRIFNILQLRLHPAIIALKSEIENAPSEKVHQVDLTYITSRGPWYQVSWKGNVEKSGGIVTNIGIHFFDMLIWIFGDVQDSIVELSNANTAHGHLRLANAHVDWFLSVDSSHLPASVLHQGQRTYRSIRVDEEEIEFSDGFTDLHTHSYQKILDGNGYGTEEVRKCVDLVSTIRNAV